jgi:hypothetical protein
LHFVGESLKRETEVTTAGSYFLEIRFDAFGPVTIEFF